MLVPSQSWLWPPDHLHELITGRRAILNKAREIYHEMDWNVIHYEILNDNSSSLLGFLGTEYQHPSKVRLDFADGHYIDCTFEGEKAGTAPAPALCPDLHAAWSSAF